MRRSRFRGLALAGAVGLCCAAGGCGGKPMIRPPEAEGVSFLVTPSDAEIVIDNAVSGKASDYSDERPLKIPVGEHTLEVRAPGYESYVRPLSVSPNAKRIEATLPRKEEPPAAPKEKSGSVPAGGALPKTP